MSNPRNQVSLAETYKSKAFEAWAFLQSLEKQIEDKNDLLKSAGVSFRMSGCTESSGSESGFSQAIFSDSAMHMMLEKIPHTTESIEKEIKRQFSAKYDSRKASIFSDQALFEKVDEELERLRLKEMKEAIEWVKVARTPDGYSWKEKNYKAIPEKVRVMATPEASKGTDHWRWRHDSAFDRLRTLELALYSLAGDPLPEKLLGDRIYKTWEKESSTTGYKPDGIETFTFKSKYFELKAYRKAPDQITFSRAALALLNQEKYIFTKWWKPQKVKVILDDRQQKAIDWLRKCPAVTGKVRTFQDYTEIPKTVRIDVTPNISKNHNFDFFGDSKIWENLAALEHAIYKLSGRSLPEKFMFQVIKETWDQEFRGGKREVYSQPQMDKGDRYNEALKFIKTMNFDGDFFTLKANRSTPDQIIFTDEALELLNGKTSVDSTSLDTETKAKMTAKAEDKTEAEPLKIVSNPEKDGQRDLLAEVLEFEAQWLVRRAELRKKAYEEQMKKISAKSADTISKKEIDDGIELMNMHHETEKDLPKMTGSKAKLQEVSKVRETLSVRESDTPTVASPEIICQFSEKQGFIVSGLTREIASKLGRKGLGLSYWGAKKVWYIRGSKGRPWAERYDELVKDLEEICKAHMITFSNKTSFAKAA